MRLKTLFFLIFSGFIPFVASATTISQTIRLVLPSDGSEYNLNNGSTFDTVTVNSNSFTFVIPGTGSVELVSQDKKNLSNDGSYSVTCNSSDSHLVMSVPSGGTTKTVIVTPSGSCSSSSGSTSSGGGGSPSLGATFGGGGGGTYTPPPPTPTPQPAPAPMAVLPPVSAIPTMVITFSKDLSIGMQGDDVAKLQALFSADKALYPEGIVNGVFGPATIRAVKRFQAKYGLPQLGRVGPATRKKLNEIFGTSQEMPLSIPTPSPLPSPSNNTSALFTNDLFSGMKNNDDVLRLQTLLANDKDIYPEGILSGNFGPSTLRAVKRFQAKYGLPQLGRVGPATRKKLNEIFGVQQLSPPMMPPTSQSSSANDAVVQQLQEQLQALQSQLKTMPGQ